MGIFSRDYSVPGPGIDPDAPEKKGLSRFYEIFFEKFWKLIQLNMIYIVFLIPTFAITFIAAGAVSNNFMETYRNIFTGSDLDAEQVSYAVMLFDVGIRFAVTVLFMLVLGGGPVTAGQVYVLRKFTAGDPVFLMSDFIDGIKKNFWQGLAVYIIDLVAAAVVWAAFVLYGKFPAPLVYLKYLVLLLAFFWILVHQFVYHLMVTYKLSIGKLFKNAALFLIPSFPYSLVAFVIVVFAAAIFPAIAVMSSVQKLSSVFAVISFLLFALILFSFGGLVREYNAYKQVERYIAADTDVEMK